MTRNPMWNALLAAGYITAVGTFMYYAPQFAGPAQDSVLMPMAVLSLFVLSAALMGFLFFYQPAQMFLAGEKKEAVDLFLRTVGVFAVITFVFFAALFLVR